MTIHTQVLHFNDEISPGHAVRVIENEKVVFDSSGGARSRLFTNPVGSQDKWHIGSCTKSMTAYLIGILIDEKKLALNTPISEFFKLESAIKNNITIQDLLTHRSGLIEIDQLPEQSIWQNLSYSENRIEARAKLAKAILNEKTKFEKDANFEYLNTNYILLGSIIEKIEKKEWEDVLVEKIFNRLGMKSCGFGPAATRDHTPPDQPWGHKVKENKLISVQPLSSETEPSDNPPIIGPAGTVHCSFDSWSLFLNEMLAASHGRSTLLSQETSKKLFSHYKDKITYGGWGISEKTWAGGTVYTMVGSNELNYAMFLIAPSKNMILMGATNSGSDESLQELTNNLRGLANSL